jgi:DNA-binding SARP family transcriptional activator/tetratricopeptide (TPR) repeat protein
VQSEASPFNLKLLTGFRFEIDGQEIDIPGQKSRALLCVLALQSNKPQSRAFLADMLWDTMDADAAATNLRQTLSVIKRALGDHFGAVLDVTKLTLGFQAGAVIIDALLPQLIDATPANELKLFGGLGAKSRRFETWLRDQNAQILTGAITRCQRALNNAMAASQHETALQLALRLHELDPDNERGALQAHAIMLALGQNYDAAAFARANPEVTFEAPAPATAAPLTAVNNDAPIILIGRFNCQPDDRPAVHIAISLSEAVVGDLAESAWVRVIAPDLTNLSAPMFGLAQSQPALARWNYRLDGAIQSSPLAASVWLTSGADQTVIWTERFTSTTIGSLADTIVSRVAASLESVVLDAEGKRATHVRTLAGYWEDLARARTLFWRASQSANQEAETLLDNMLEDAPHDVRVLTLAAYAKLMNAWSGWQGVAAINLDQAARFSRRAIQSVPDDAWSLMTMATVLSARLDLVGARRKVEQALAIRPYLAAAKGELARVLVFSGETLAGQTLAREALEASPRDPHASLWLRTGAFAAWMDGDFSRAAELAELAIEKRTNWYPNFLTSAVANVRAGKLDAARRAIIDARELGAGALSNDALRCGHPFEDRLVFEQFLADLRVAGWGES